MAIYFEATNDSNKVTLNDSDSFLFISRHGNLADLADGVAGTYWPSHGAYTSLYFDGSSVMVCYKTFVIKHAAGEITAAIKPTVSSLNAAYAIFKQSQGYSVILVAGTYGCSSDEFESFVNGLTVYMIGDVRSSTKDFFGMELYNSNNKLIYRTTDSLVNIVGMYFNDLSFFIDLSGAKIGWKNVGAVNSEKGQYYKTVSAGFLHKNKALMINTQCTYLVAFLWGSSVEFLIPTFWGFTLYNGVVYCKPISINSDDITIPLLGQINVYKAMSYDSYALFIDTASLD